ncbi:ubiquitin thiolesterase [Niveomyces insectorum RCEF 264]|uniref:ubiquitinyl hydrolase 1 n=1 Tax=Niveomyces insectorum RCEF 264 TaxID=1081102 RepID=A0A167UMS1_9HYPO|nr:ubiquitin thiolesterase [Niveomyces insectorum RCEF 264]
MFLPPAAPDSVLDAPFPITIEFTDYASYQHHQLRQQQYQAAYLRQQGEEEQEPGLEQLQPQQHQLQPLQQQHQLQQQQQQQQQQPPYEPFPYPPQPQELPQFSHQLPHLLQDNPLHTDRNPVSYQPQPQQQQQQQQQQPPAIITGVPPSVHGDGVVVYGRNNFLPAAATGARNGSSDPPAGVLSASASDAARKRRDGNGDCGRGGGRDRGYYGGEDGPGNGDGRFDEPHQQEEEEDAEEEEEHHRHQQPHDQDHTPLLFDNALAPTTVGFDPAVAQFLQRLSSAAAYKQQPLQPPLQPSPPFQPPLQQQQQQQQQHFTSNTTPTAAPLAPTRVPARVPAPTSPTTAAATAAATTNERPTASPTSANRNSNRNRNTNSVTSYPPPAILTTTNTFTANHHHHHASLVTPTASSPLSPASISAAFAASAAAAAANSSSFSPGAHRPHYSRRQHHQTHQNHPSLPVHHPNNPPHPIHPHHPHYQHHQHLQHVIQRRRVKSSSLHGFAPSPAVGAQAISPSSSSSSSASASSSSYVQPHPSFPPPPPQQQQQQIPPAPPPFPPQHAVMAVDRPEDAARTTPAGQAAAPTDGIAPPPEQGDLVADGLSAGLDPGLDTGLDAGLSNDIAAEIAAQEAAARDYQPDLSGPAIHELRPTEDVKEQYAAGDHAFVQKTAKLPRTFPLYRSVRGDGNCGWRAIGFCYFEALVYAGNLDQIVAERARLHGLNDYIREVGGYDPYVYEDMVEETDLLFAALLAELPDTARAIQVLTNTFNDDPAGNAIIYHLRLLTAAYLKGNVDRYEGFIAHDAGVIGYCQEWIERPNCEIDHLRVEVLASILLKPVDIVLEIAYLDRSDGDAVAVYSFPDTNIGRQEATIGMRMSLLFRPDHYDILYRPGLPSPAVADAVLRPFHTAGGGPGSNAPKPGLTSNTIHTIAATTNTAAVPPPPPPVSGMTARQPATSLAAAPVYLDRLMASAHTTAGLAEAPSIREDTPELTSASSTASPPPVPVKEEEPLTPTLMSPPSMVRPTAAAVSGRTPGAENVAGGGSGGGSGGDPNHPLASIPPSQAATSTSASQQPRPSPPPPSANDLQVNRVTSVTHDAAAQALSSLGNFATADMSVLSFLPTMFGSYGTQSPFAASPFTAPMPFAPPPPPPQQQQQQSPRSPWVAAASTSPHAGFGDNYSPFSMSASPMTPSWPGSTPAGMRPVTPMAMTPVGGVQPPPPPPQPPTPQPTLPTTLSHTSGGNSSSPFQPELPESHPVRFTKWQFERPFQTPDNNGADAGSFRNSRFSTAHFSNPEFQPEEYRPSGDEGGSNGGGGGVGKPGAGRSRRKSHREANDKEK